MSTQTLTRQQILDLVNAGHTVIYKGRAIRSALDPNLPVDDAAILADFPEGLTGNVLIGSGATASELRFFEPSGGGTNYTAFKAQLQANDLIYTLPSAQSAGMLKNDGSGLLTWEAAGGGLTVGTTAVASGSSGRILYETSGNVLGEIPNSQATTIGTISLTASDAATNAVTTIQTLGHNTSGTPLAGYGVGIDFQSQSSTTENTAIGRITSKWITATHSTRKSSVNIEAWSPLLATYTGLLVSTVELGGGGVVLSPTALSSPNIAIQPSGGGGTVQLANNYAYFGAANSVAFFNVNAGNFNAGAGFAGNPAIQINNSGRVGVNIGAVDTDPVAQFKIISGAASRVGLRVDSPANSTGQTIIEAYRNSTTLSFAAGVDLYDSALGMARFDVWRGTGASTNQGYIQAAGYATWGLGQVNWGPGSYGLGWGSPVGNSYFRLENTGSFQFNSSGYGTLNTPDVFLRRGGAAILQLGTDAAVPVEQTIKAHNGVGTDIAGAPLNISGGKGTGAGTGGDVKLQVALAGVGGASLNSLTTVLTAAATTNAIKIVSPSASMVSLRVDSSATPSVNVFETTINGTAGTGFVVTSTGAPSSTGTGGAGAERFGLLSTISVARGVALGWTANVAQIDGIAIGYNASATGAGSGGIAIGTNNNAQGASIAMSAGNTTATSGAIAIQATGTYAGQQTIYIGPYTGPGTGGSGTGGVPQAAIAIGGGGKPEGDNNAVFSTTGGTVGDGIGRVWFGKGVTHATPTSVTINGTGGSGSNIAGADVIIAGGKNTGSPTSTATGNVRLATSIVGAAASTLNTLVDRLVIANRKTLTDASTNLFEVSLPTLKGCMGTIRYEIYASDGTDIQVRRGQAQFSAVNKAGVYTTEIAVLNEAISASSGTLTATFAITGGTNKITISVTPSGSLTESTYYILYTLENNSEQVITIL